MNTSNDIERHAGVGIDPAFVREHIAAHPDSMKKRYLIRDLASGIYLVTVYAERFELVGESTAHFCVGNDVVASVELGQVSVVDSGGRLWEREIDIESRIKHDLRRLADLAAVQ